MRTTNYYDCSNNDNDSHPRDKDGEEEEEEEEGEEEEHKNISNVVRTSSTIDRNIFSRLETWKIYLHSCNHITYLHKGSIEREKGESPLRVR